MQVFFHSLKKIYYKLQLYHHFHNLHHIHLFRLYKSMDDHFQLFCFCLDNSVCFLLKINEFFFKDNANHRKYNQRYKDTEKACKCAEHINHLSFFMFRFVSVRAVCTALGLIKKHYHINSKNLNSGL